MQWYAYFVLVQQLTVVAVFFQCIGQISHFSPDVLVEVRLTYELIKCVKGGYQNAKEVVFSEDLDVQNTVDSR